MIPRILKKPAEHGRLNKIFFKLTINVKDVLYIFNLQAQFQDYGLLGVPDRLAELV